MLQSSGTYYLINFMKNFNPEIDWFLKHFSIPEHVILAHFEVHLGGFIHGNGFLQF